MYNFNLISRIGHGLLALAATLVSMLVLQVAMLA
jgi:hypothetical protein